VNDEPTINGQSATDPEPTLASVNALALQVAADMLCQQWLHLTPPGAGIQTQIIAAVLTLQFSASTLVRNGEAKSKVLNVFDQWVARARREVENTPTGALRMPPGLIRP
jgi:hypothetical protein